MDGVVAAEKRRIRRPAARVWVSRPRGARRPPVADAMSDAPGEIPGLFAIGVAAMLLPPIFLALCAAWLCSQDRRIRRSKAKIAEQEQGDDDSEGDFEGDFEDEERMTVLMMAGDV